MARYAISCRDIDPQLGCGFRSEGGSIEEAGREFMRHGTKEHGFQSAGAEALQRLEASLREFLGSQDRPDPEKDQNVSNRTPVNRGEKVAYER